jgi:hypothetical protein
MEIKKYNQFLKESGVAISDPKLEVLNRTKELNEEEFLEILKSNCKNFSFDSDLLWRSKDKKYDLELFTPAPRNAAPLAFKDFFDEIELNTDEYPVVRKNSLIGGTNKDICKILAEGDIYLVIPFDNSEMIFCPICDLWGLRDRNGSIRNSDQVAGRRISKDNFIKVNYTENFKVPLSELNSLPKANTGAGGCEFFISSPCLLVHESKIDWLKENLK